MHSRAGLTASFLRRTRALLARRPAGLLSLAQGVVLSILASGPAQAQPALANVTKIVSYSTNNCALTSVGSVWCWGENGIGQLGAGTTEPWRAAIRATGLSSGATGVAVGEGRGAAVDSSGSALQWGAYGGSTPSLVSNLNPPGVTAIAGGSQHTCALTTAGGVKCWGLASDGQLGDGLAHPESVFNPVDTFGLASGVSAIALGAYHSCALTSTGGVKCWGLGTAGQLGDSFMVSRLAPVNVFGLASGVQAIAAGLNHTCALTTTGGVKCWGSNGSGQLGNPLLLESSIPADVPGLTSGVLAIALGQSHSCALLAAGGAKCWGANGSGQLGDNSTDTRFSPVDLTVVSGAFTALSAGAAHTCALMALGGVKCWGSNAYGSLGNNTTDPSLTPVDVLVLDDTVPDAFGFATQADVLPGPIYVSNTLTPTGFDRDVPVSMTSNGDNSFYSIGCGGVWTNAPGIFLPGQTVCVRASPPGIGGTSTVFTLTLGGTSGTFTLTTVVMPTSTILSGPVTSVAGATVTFTATMSGYTTDYTGTATFSDGATAIAGCSLLPVTNFTRAAECQTNALTPGVHSITASYSGGTGGLPSTSQPFLHGVGTSTVTLAVAKSGAGGGTVTSSVTGIDCGSTCTTTLPTGASLALTATPAAGSVLTSWTGCDSATGPVCTLTSVSANRTVAARFTLIVPIAPGPPTLASATGENGLITVRFSPPLSDGDAPISGYSTTCNPGAHAASGAASPLVVPGLVNDATYFCTVVATNSAGTSVPSNALTATPMVTVAGPLAYVQNGGEDVTVIDSATKRVVATTTVGADHREIIVHPFLPRAYVPRYGGNSGTTVSVIDTSINTVTGSIPVGTGPDGVGLSPSGDRLYVASYISGDITVVETSTANVLATVPVMTGVAHLAVHPSGNRLYTLAGSNLAVIDTSTFAVTILPLAGVANDVVVNPDGTRVYVSYATAALGLAVIDAASNAVLTTVPYPFGFSAGMAMNGPGTRIFMAGWSSDQFLMTFDATNNTLIGLLHMGGAGCSSFGCIGYYDVAVSPTGGKFYMSAGRFNDIAEFDAGTSALVTRFGLGASPISLAFPPAPAGPPIIGAASAGNGSASVAFTPPASTGGSAITGYAASCSPGLFSGTGPTSPITVSGLNNGTAYTCQVWAINASGAGPTSAPSNSVTPGTAPTITSPSSTALTSSTATLGGNVTSDGGSAITERGVVYSQTASNTDPLIGGGGVTKVTVIGTTGLFASGVTGLTPTTSHSFKAFATNLIETSYTSVATFTTTCPTITLASLPNGNLNAAYTGSVTASGGTGPYTYAITSGALPGGLSLTASGAGAGDVGGTPTTTGTFPFDITATDTSGAGTCTGVQSYSVVINPELGQDFFTLTPCRVLDTRNAAGPLGGPGLVALSDRIFEVAGTCGIPADAKAISLNLAVTGPTNPGNIRLHPGGTAVPLVSSINFKAGQTRSNNAVIPLSALGQLAAYLDQAAGTAHLIVDVNGYFK